MEVVQNQSRMTDALFVVRRKRKIVGVEYWTGLSWGTYPAFAKSYTLVDGIDVIKKRFHRQVPRPMLVARKGLHA